MTPNEKECKTLRGQLFCISDCEKRVVNVTFKERKTKKHIVCLPKVTSMGSDKCALT